MFICFLLCLCCILCDENQGHLRTWFAKNPLNLQTGDGGDWRNYRTERFEAASLTGLFCHLYVISSELYGYWRTGAIFRKHKMAVLNDATQRRNGDYTVMHCAGVFSQIKNFACDRQKIKNFRRFFSC